MWRSVSECWWDKGSSLTKSACVPENLMSFEVVEFADVDLREARGELSVMNPLLSSRNRTGFSIFLCSNTAFCWKPSPPRVYLSSASCWRSRSTATTTSTSWRPFRRSWCSSTKVSASRQVGVWVFIVRHQRSVLPPNSWRVERGGHNEVVLRRPPFKGEERLPRADEDIRRVAEERRGR